MEYGPCDSSGTDDDLPPSLHNRGMRGGRVNGNGIAMVGAIPYPRVQNDMEVQIHLLEQEAYSSVLRAFKAQSDAITWEKESLITELRKELRVSDEEHRELLSRVNADAIIQRIREWRQAGCIQTGMLSNAQPDAISPSVSASRKRQKTSQPIPSLSLGVPSPALHSQLAASMQPPSSAAKSGAAAATKGMKPKSGQTFPGGSSVKSMQYSSASPSGRGGQVANRNSSGACAAGESAEPASFDPLIGRKVMTRWPEDNNFYEAVITDYNPVEGLHALVYDINTVNETWEWVNLKEISPEDIRWEGEDPVITYWSGQGAPGCGLKRTTGHGGAIPVSGRGRGFLKNEMKNDFPTSQNGISKRTGDAEIFQTDTLIKEVEKLLGASHPDPVEFEKAKKILKEHEESLIDAIARLPAASDSESEEAGHQSMDRNQGWRNRQHDGDQQEANYDDDMAVEGREGSKGDQMVADGVALGY